MMPDQPNLTTDSDFIQAFKDLELEFQRRAAQAEKMADKAEKDHGFDEGFRSHASAYWSAVAIVRARLEYEFEPDDPHTKSSWEMLTTK
jgi:hypothetical protein